MEDAQRELEKNATPGQNRADEEDDEDDEDQDDVPGFERGGARGGATAAGTAHERATARDVPGAGSGPQRSQSQPYGGDAEMRSVLSSDRDLLEGADAEAGTTNSSRESTDGHGQGSVSVGGHGSGGRGTAAAEVVGVEFEG